MAGPTASILIPELMTEAARTAVRADIRQMASEVKGDDFWIQGRPFILGLGPELKGELKDLEDEGLPQIIGWLPRDMIIFAAMCNDSQDHQFLAELCLYFARKMRGVIDFQGALLPPIPGEAKQLFHDYFEGGNDWDEWEPYFRKMVENLPGKLYEIRYKTANGDHWVHHMCDADFLAAWLCHPNFHMVK